MFQMRKETARRTDAPESGGGRLRLNSYITVANVDASLKNAQERAPRFRATLRRETAGDAVLQAPTGAVFQLWQPNRSMEQYHQRPGALSGRATTTRTTARRFYTNSSMDAEHSAAWRADGHRFSVGGTPSIVMMPKPRHARHSRVLDSDFSRRRRPVSQCEELGGKVMVPADPTFQDCRFAIVTDRRVHVRRLQFTPA